MLLTWSLSVKDLITDSYNPVTRHLIAQVGIEFSNSLIEAANKQEKKLLRIQL